MRNQALHTQVGRKIYARLSTAACSGIAISLLLANSGGCHNPVSDNEARKYVAPRSSPGAGPIVICRVVPDCNWLSNARREVRWTRNRKSRVIGYKLLDNGYMGEEFSCPITDDGWYCWDLLPGTYQLHGIMVSGRSTGPYTSDTSITSPIHAQFSVHHPNAVYIGTLAQEKSGQWVLKNELESAATVLKRMRPASSRPLSVELARWD